MPLEAAIGDLPARQLAREHRPGIRARTLSSPTIGSCRVSSRAGMPLCSGWACLGWLASALLSTSAVANVLDIGASGFTVQRTIHIKAPPEKVYAALIAPERWWASDHTFSGNATNLHLEAKAGGCWCETLPGGGSVLHLTVVYVAPGKALRLRGALGPFQALGVDGSLTWALKPAGDGTELTTTYQLGGYIKEGFQQLSQAADRMLSEQDQRLKRLIETGSADPR